MYISLMLMVLVHLFFYYYIKLSVHFILLDCALYHGKDWGVGYSFLLFLLFFYVFFFNKVDISFSLQLQFSTTELCDSKTWVQSG